MRDTGEMNTPMTQVPPLPVWTIGDRLVKARQFAGLSQTQMAQQLRIGRRSIVRYEASNDPPRSIVISYSAITAVPIWWFDDDSGPNPAFTQHYRQHSRLAEVDRPRILSAA